MSLACAGGIRQLQELAVALPARGLVRCCPASPCCLVMLEAARGCRVEYRETSEGGDMKY